MCLRVFSAMGNQANWDLLMERIWRKQQAQVARSCRDERATGMEVETELWEVTAGGWTKSPLCFMCNCGETWVAGPLGGAAP